MFIQTEFNEKYIDIVGIPEYKEKEIVNISYHDDRYIYNDLMRRSGAIVFSSSLGGERLLESNILKNY